MRYGAEIAYADVADLRADLDHLHSQLMTGNPRVAVKRHLAEVPGIIGPANANSVHAHMLHLVETDEVTMTDMDDPKLTATYRLA